jgi:tetratricopeptide (TPR) repeat protein
MALVICPECGKNISSTSKICVNCGYNLSSETDLKKYLELAKLSLEGQAHEKVVEYCDKALEIDSKCSEAWFLKAQSVGYGSSLQNMKFDQTILAYEKAIEYSKSKRKTADELVLPCTLQVVGLVDNAKSVIKLSLGMKGTDEIHLLMSYWITILSHPSVSKEKLVEIYPLFLQYSEMNSMRLAAITFANKVDYHILLQENILKLYPEFVFPAGKTSLLKESNEKNKTKIEQENPIEKSNVNPGLYFLICVSLGYLGIHHFKTGKITKGLLYFFTFGLLGFGWLNDIIEFLLGKTKDYKGKSIKL